MSNISFYEVSAAVIPLFILTIAIQSRLFHLLSRNRVEFAERELLLELADGIQLSSDGGNRTNPKSFSSILAHDYLSEAVEAGVEARARQRNWVRNPFRLFNILTYGPVLLGFVSLGVSVAVLYAGSAPWWVGLAVWPGLAALGLLLCFMIMLSIWEGSRVAQYAARERLADLGLTDRQDRATLRSHLTTQDDRRQRDMNAPDATDLVRAKSIQQGHYLLKVQQRDGDTFFQ